MTKGRRFKIDFYDSSHRPFGLYFNQGNMWGGDLWRLIETFESRDAAHAFYTKVKDLPEYLP